ncbi:hypothetical protein GQ53DRAFT_815939 [Thozetella sp. PMI_491]|nr:hypothetical protein GQ53DRAFT_815939 [Thozetella sp. PMI_491]
MSAQAVVSYENMGPTSPAGATYLSINSIPIVPSRLTNGDEVEVANVVGAVVSGVDRVVGPVPVGEPRVEPPRWTPRPGVPLDSWDAMLLGPAVDSDTDAVEGSAEGSAEGSVVALDSDPAAELVGASELVWDADEGSVGELAGDADPDCDADPDSVIDEAVDEADDEAADSVLDEAADSVVDSLADSDGDEDSEPVVVVCRSEPPL